jgi:hypothetical protein
VTAALQMPDELKIVQVLLSRAARAREDPGAFMELVMRRDEDHSPVTCAPHQRVLFDFMLGHRRGVVMVCRGGSKTFCLAAWLLWSMGRDPSYRAAVVSKNEAQALKLVQIVRDTIETNPILPVVFPNLKRSPNRFHGWTKQQLTIARPSGTRDPTLAVYGRGGAIRGSRLKEVFIDDILDQENVKTEEQRDITVNYVDSDVQRTLDTTGEARVFLIGTPLHPKDILHVAKQRGWATLAMNIKGDITVDDDVDRWNRVDGGDYWDHPLLRLSRPPFLRLTSFPDEENLFPSRWGSEVEAARLGKWGYVRQQRETSAAWTFQTEQMLKAQDYELAMCRPEWVQACQKLARERGHREMPHRSPPNGNLRFLGVDLAIKVGEHHDLTAFFGYEVLPTGHRLVLDVEFGRWDLATKMAKVGEKWDAFRYDLILVEDNGAQSLFVEQANDTMVYLPVKGDATGSEKSHPEIGIPGLFNEIFRGAWLFPSDDWDRSPKPLQAALDAAVDYVPDKHTKDVLMAWYLAYKCARRWGVGTAPPAEAGGEWAQDLLVR